jgi:hypothetical protein
MDEGISIDRSSGIAYRIERMGRTLLFQASNKMGEQFIDPALLPKNLERVPNPLSTNLQNLMETIEDFYTEVTD